MCGNNVKAQMPRNGRGRRQSSEMIVETTVDLPRIVAVGVFRIPVEHILCP